MVGDKNDEPSANPKNTIDPGNRLSNQAEAKPTVKTKPRRNWRVWEANRKV